MLRNEFIELIGFEGSIIDLSNELQVLGCEDICYFGNWSEILDSGDVVVSIDDLGENHIHIFFDVVFPNGDDEVLEATIINIKNVVEF